MIIKSMTRKDSSFGQLIAYIERDAADARFSLHHRLGHARVSQDIVAAFQANASHLPVRRNGVALYHEILSITRASALAEDEQKRILKQIAEDYIAARAPLSMAYGVLHDDQAKQLHYHLVISANGLADKKRQRLSKSEFNAIKQDLERQVLRDYPELEQKVAMNRTAKEKLSRPADALQRRTGEIPQRDAVKGMLSELLVTCHSRQELDERLKAADLELYWRGNTVGIVNLATGRKHRLKSLGLDDTYDIALRRMALTEARPAPSVQVSDTLDLEIRPQAQDRSTGPSDIIDFDLSIAPQREPQPAIDLELTGYEDEPLTELASNIPPVRPPVRHLHTVGPSLIERVIAKTVEGAADVVRRSGAKVLNEAVDITKQAVTTLTASETEPTRSRVGSSHRPARPGQPDKGVPTPAQDTSFLGDSWNLQPAPEPISDAERIAAERRQEMERLRLERDHRDDDHESDRRR